MNRSRWLRSAWIRRVWLAICMGPILFLPVGCSREGAGGSGEIPVMVSPARMAMNGGSLFVSDCRTKNIYIMLRDDLSVGGFFRVEGTPLAVGIARNRVYVGNEATGSVEVYSLPGIRLSYLGGAGGLIKRPSDLAVDQQADRIFVVDGFDKNVKVYDLNGAAITTIGTGTLLNPTVVALDTARGEVFVADYGNVNQAFGNPAGVRVFDYAGASLRTITGSSGGFSRPQGLAIDDGHLFLADAFLGQILVFDAATGTKVKTLGSFGAGPGQLQLPLDVVVDPVTKNVYVTNNRLARVEVFEKGGMVP